MTSIFKTSLLALLIAAQVGCTSLKPVAPGCTGSACTVGLKSGDEIVVDTRTQTNLALTVQQADAQHIIGQTADTPPHSVVIDADSITSMQKRELNKMRTAGAVVGAGVAVTTVLVIVTAVGLGAAMAAAL